MFADPGNRPRLDSVEIRVTFSGTDAAAALRTLAPDHGGARRRVYFCEAVTHFPYTPGTLAHSRTTPGLPLMDAGVTLRLRVGSGRGGGGDATAVLRPCRTSRITEHWLGFRAQGPDSLRLGGDWSGENRVLAASFACDCGRTAVEAVTSGGAPPATAFSGRQRAFLAECADVRVGPGDLAVLGPVLTQRWSGVRLDHHRVRLERWSLRGSEPMEWFEVSERVAPEGAEVVQASLTVLLRGQGLEPDLAPKPLTRRVLEALALGTRVPGHGLGVPGRRG
ncbi:hypothetical protein [Streptomyces poonensis]|uniref:Uncharacterized protein n=1 Tax=Streptomyces poonensis TaxID=68255 RepID=A0A918PLW7_9ACTN|nr:hypothetical protein [Streptomyces poonensis]GGZ15626.1 hypothetical protein GCM10010365_39310 [Streptomyces poonensis]GLJ91534.1 hypothetical protein GCM10017589_41410 [Streptomyces poonensis]